MSDDGDVTTTTTTTTLQRWFLSELKRSFPSSEDWLLDGLSLTCVASTSVEESVDAMRNFIGGLEDETIIAEALRLSERLFEKKQEEEEEKEKEKVEEKATSSTASFSSAAPLRKGSKEKTSQGRDVHVEVLDDKKKGEAKAYRKYEPEERPSVSSEISSKARREHRSIRVKTTKKKSGTTEEHHHGKTKIPGDALDVRDLLKPHAANCLRCGKIFRFDLDASGAVAENDARAFLQMSGKCTFCDAFVNVKLKDGLVWNGGTGYITEQEREEETEDGKAAVKLKDQLVSFDRSGASRTKVVDDQSEWYDHGDVDAEAWLAEDERRALKHKRDVMDQQARERELAKKKTFGIDILGRKTMALDEEELKLIRERDERAKLAMESAALNSLSESAQGGGSAMATAAQTAKELESRIGKIEHPPLSETKDLEEEQKMRVPRNKTLNITATFVKSFKDIASSKVQEDEKWTENIDELSRLEANAPRRVLDINPFDQIAEEAADAGLGFIL